MKKMFALIIVAVIGFGILAGGMLYVNEHYTKVRYNYITVDRSLTWLTGKVKVVRSRTESKYYTGEVLYDEIESFEIEETGETMVFLHEGDSGEHTGVR